MAKDLTTSQIDRQNILNNQYAIDEIRSTCTVVMREDTIIFMCKGNM